MSVIDEIKARIDILELISETVNLRKAGKSYKGLCPFHAEKTPSFVVFPDTGTWRCFGACAEGGDVYSFVMKRDNLEFREALRLLAQRAGVELQPRTPEATAEEKQRDLLRQIVQAAAVYFHHLLSNADEAARARAYLKRRGLSDTTVEDFQVGYALDRWEGTIHYLTGKGYQLEDLHKAGLVTERADGSGYYDRFRGRLMFPIRDARGRTVGFGGRILGAEDAGAGPKYLNSPQTPIFDKSSVLYGIDRAHKAIREADQAVIVEGYMDVLMAHQHGLNNVVAQMGTALTESQLRLLKRYTQNLVLALDSDAAGQQATLRGLDVAREVLDREVVPVPTPRGLIRFEDRLEADLRILALPLGLDPDEVIRESTAHWVRLVADAKPVMEFYFVALTADLDLDTARGKSDAVRRLGPLIAELTDQVQRDHYVQKLALLVQVNEEAVWAQIRALGRQRTRTRARPRARPPGREPDATPPASQQPEQRLEDHCLSLLLRHPGLAAEADAVLQASGQPPVRGDDFAQPENREIFRAWQQAEPAAPDLEERRAWLMALDADRPPMPEDRVKDEVVDAVLRFRLRNLRHRIHDLRFLQQEAQQEPEDEAIVTYGQLVAQHSRQVGQLQRALDERSIMGRRRREDEYVRVLTPDE
jgi:DNA primase